MPLELNDEQRAMNTERKVFVSIYCKIYTDSFSEELVNRAATGTEIFDFLMADSGQCFDENGNQLEGDCNLWYLGCNEKAGYMVLEDRVICWGFGESSFEHVKDFVNALYDERLISDQQYLNLVGKMCEGQLIDNMYDIRDYLICKRDGKPWVKTNASADFREDIKRILVEVEALFKEKGYRIY
jgi:hypothetical protein